MTPKPLTRREAQAFNDGFQQGREEAWGWFVEILQEAVKARIEAAQPERVQEMEPLTRRVQ
jgi:hypothetical protein